MNQLLTSKELSDLLHADLIKVVTEAVRRGNLVRKGDISPSDATGDLRLDLEDFFTKAARNISCALVLKK